MIAKILGTFVLAALAGALYRMGGSGKFPRFVRPLGLCICTGIALTILGFIHWTSILAMGAIYGLSTTYFKKKGTDAQWYNWSLVGLAFGISVIPIVFVYHNWLGFGIRCLACTVLTTLWSTFIGKDVVEEMGRGAIAIGTLPLLLIGA